MYFWWWETERRRVWCKSTAILLLYYTTVCLLAGTTEKETKKKGEGACLPLIWSITILLNLYCSSAIAKHGCQLHHCYLLTTLSSLLPYTPFSSSHYTKNYIFNLWCISLFLIMTVPNHHNFSQQMHHSSDSFLSGLSLCYNNLLLPIITSYIPSLPYLFIDQLPSCYRLLTPHNTITASIIL